MLVGVLLDVGVWYYAKSLVIFPKEDDLEEKEDITKRLALCGSLGNVLYIAILVQNNDNI